MKLFRRREKPAPTLTTPGELIVEFVNRPGTREWAWTICDKTAARRLAHYAHGDADSLTAAEDAISIALNHWARTHGKLAVIRHAYAVKFVDVDLTGAGTLRWT